ncbi:MAG TPA: DMT family transporter [Ensifer sp.]|nr:DMT family transporter [Ensifer sp.]
MSQVKTTHNAHAKGREKLLAHLAMLSFALLISASFSFGGIAAHYASSAAMNALRYILSVVVMWVFAVHVMKVKLTFPREPWRYAILGLLMAIYMYTMFIALQFTSPVATGAVFTLMPLISAGFAFLLMRQYTRPAVLTSLVVAALGSIWVIFRGDVAAILGFEVGRGEAIYFIGVVAHAAYAPLLRYFGRGEPAVYSGFWAVAATGAWLMIPGIPALISTDLLAFPAAVWGTVVYTAVGTTVITFLLLQYAALRLPASKTLAYGYLTPSFIIVIEGLLGHGWVAVTIWIGALVTALGLAISGLLPD